MVEIGYEPITVTVLDTQAGKTAKDSRTSAYSWALGNWSCDCNRADAFGYGNEWSSRCLGCKRFLVVAATGLMNGYTIADMNEGYPLELCEKHPASMRGTMDHNYRYWTTPKVTA